MANAFRKFVDSLSHCGIVSDDEIRSVVRSLTVSGRRIDLDHFVDALVRLNKITQFQVEALQRGQLKGLAFGDYVILELIGTGGMGHVFKARHRRMERDVAIKVLHDGAARSSESFLRFQREVRTAARLEHPNIVRAYDAGDCDGALYLVLQYIDGGDLKTLVDRFGTMTVPQAVYCLLQVARGLEFAHGEGVVHRDIKPANLLLDRHGVVRILDMGLALAIEEDGEDGRGDRLTMPGELLGTADFMAPEQAEDTRLADARSDIYSLGCTLYYLLNGRAPFQGETFLSVLLSHRDAPVPRLCPPDDDASEILDEIFRLAVAKDPDRRYQSVAAMIADLELLPQERLCWAGDERDARPSRSTMRGRTELTTSVSQSAATIVARNPRPQPRAAE